MKGGRKKGEGVVKGDVEVKGKGLVEGDRKNKEK